MIEAYWNEVFGEFKSQTGKFEIPQMPEPLMSAHFGVSNLVGFKPSEFKQTFYLSVFEPKTWQLSSIIQKESLQEALENLPFWESQKRLNPEAVSFIQRLLPFLITLDTPHHHFYLKLQNEIVATALVGEASCGCFLFNLSVDQRVRKQGLGQEMLKVIQNEFSSKKTFYWTKHEWFTLEGEVIPLTLV